MSNNPSKKEKEVLLYYAVGLVERPAKAKNSKSCIYRWAQGYSLRKDGGSQPWVTRREAQSIARLMGVRAKFIEANE